MPGSIQYSIALRSNGADTDKQVTSKTHEYNIYENKNRTRQLQSQVTVRELTLIETRQKVGLAIGWIDVQGFPGLSFKLSHDQFL